jgi:hypothetical protein|eukprot:COSAG03_NODE_1267_length_4431_cov_79.175439_2_plen_180_part_00
MSSRSSWTGMFSQTYGSLLTVTLHINIVPCVYLSMPEPDELDITASIMHGTVAGEVQHGGGVSDAFKFASGLQGVDKARQSTALDPEALRKKAQETLEREEKEKAEQEAKAAAAKEAREEERLALMEAGGDPQKAARLAQQRASKKAGKKKHKKNDTDVAVKTAWFDNYFEDYAEAMRE